MRWHSECGSKEQIILRGSTLFSLEVIIVAQQLLYLKVPKKGDDIAWSGAPTFFNSDCSVNFEYFE